MIGELHHRFNRKAGTRKPACPAHEFMERVLHIDLVPFLLGNARPILVEVRIRFLYGDKRVQFIVIRYDFKTVLWNFSAQAAEDKT